MAYTIDRAGRLVIPKGIREQLNWIPGSELEIVTNGEEVVIKRVNDQPSLGRIDGLLIHQGSEIAEIDIADFVRSQREGAALDQVER